MTKLILYILFTEILTRLCCVVQIDCLSKMISGGSADVDALKLRGDAR